MARTSSPSVLAQLPSLLSPDTRVAALRTLKNELIGHDEKKELWVRSGVLKPLATVMTSHIPPDMRTNKRAESRSEQEEARLQAIIVVGSLAQGGPAYTSPIYTSGCLSPLLNAISPKRSSAKTLLAALRTLNLVADSRILQHPLHAAHPDLFADLLYTEHGLENLAQVISQQSPSWTVQQQISLAAKLLSKTCHDESHRRLIEEARLYDVLAAKLASFVVATGCSLAGSYGSHTALGPPAPEKAELASILYAIVTILDTSKARWTRFLAAPAFGAVFPKTYPEGPTSFSARKLSLNHIESLIPHLQNSSRTLPTTANFPPLGAIGTSSQPSLRAFGFSIESADHAAEGHESPLVPWLIYMARADTDALARLMALHAVTHLHRCGLTHKRREAESATILVPLLAIMLDKNPVASKGLLTSLRSDDKADRRLIEEQAPAVLAKLIDDILDLQRAAIEAGSIKKLSQILKKSFDPLPPHSTTLLWSPEPTMSDRKGPSEELPFGSPGLSPAAYHVTCMRESALKGLAAIASLKDDYRRSIIENGIVPFIIQSLKPYDVESPASQLRPHIDDSKGPIAVTQNPKEVIIAACGLAQGLSRSVSTLRTSLMDAGLAAPLFLLLRHQDIEIQIASTAVVCNLVLDFSPMRQAIIDAGVLSVLCDHAHSMNAKLLLNSIWALKHLVLNADNALKKNSLDELGPGWLKQIICNGTEEFREHGQANTSLGMQTSNAAGMQVDLLNAVDSSTQNQEEDSEGDVRMSDTEPTRPKSISRLSSSLSISPNADDLAIQKEGLEFIRNLLCGEKAAEMIDYLFCELGQDKFFELLASKLRTRAHQNAYNRRTSSKPSTSALRHMQAHAEIVASVTYILVHIAAGNPRHRQQLIAQTELLRLVVPLFSHHSPAVRVCCAWLVINLTWVDNQHDQDNCKARARELGKLGVLERLKILEQDTDLDCRERAKTGTHQLGLLLR